MNLVAGVVRDGAGLKALSDVAENFKLELVPFFRFRIRKSQTSYRSTTKGSLKGKLGLTRRPYSVCLHQLHHRRTVAIKLLSRISAMTVSTTGK